MNLKCGTKNTVQMKFTTPLRRHPFSCNFLFGFLSFEITHFLSFNIGGIKFFSLRPVITILFFIQMIRLVQLFAAINEIVYSSIHLLGYFQNFTRGGVFFFFSLAVCMYLLLCQYLCKIMSRLCQSTS